MDEIDMLDEEEILEGEELKKYIRKTETGAALMNQDLIEGDLIRMADRIMDTLSTRYLIHPILYKMMRREEPLDIPEDGMREILNNAIIHKDYTGPDSQMRVFDDRITFWNQGELPQGITPESLFKPHDSYPRNRLIANAFFMAGFIESWGRGFEIITDAFKSEDLEVPTLEEEFGGVRVIIKREIFYAIQHGGRIDLGTGRLVKDGDRENDREKPVVLTQRQDLIISIIKKNDRVTTDELKEKLNVSIATVNREIKELKETRVLEREGGDNGGRWIILI